jgi:hypothetical protein
MPGPGTSFEAPLLVGTRPQSSPTTPGINDAGSAVLAQQIQLNVATGTTAVTGTAYIPIGANILDIIVDTTTAWNSATSDTLSVGTAAAGTQYASTVDVKTSAVRIRPTFTAAQLAALQTVDSPGQIFATVTQVGAAATTGATTVTILYQPTLQPFTGNT